MAKIEGTGDKKEDRGQPCNLEALRNCEEPKGHLRHAGTS
jgi:hypothetical protein